SVYGTFANGGQRVAPHLIDRVTGPDGRELYWATPQAKPALDGNVNANLGSILQDAVATGTGEAGGPPDWDVIGKTGTSEKSADGWFVGATPVLSTSVWVGFPDSERPVPGLTGGGVSAPIWREFMTQALAKTAPVGFAPASAIRTNVKPLDLP